MKKKNSSNFLIGMTIGVLVGAIIWYWQKSTSAEDGALALLDRLAAAERKLRELSMDLSNRAAGQTTARETALVTDDDLQQVRGVGPVFDERLRQAGINTFSRLAAASEEELAQILQVGRGRAESILREARDGAG